MSLRYRLAQHIPSQAVIAFARRYVAGDSLAAALGCADQLWSSRGLCTTLDVLGEHVEQEHQARRALALYRAAAEAVRGRPYCSLSIKPGHFGMYVDPALCRGQVRELGELCQLQGTRLTIDMEDVDLTDATLGLYRELKPELPVLGTVLQTRLYRTPSDLESLRGLGARIRLCIGVYDVGAQHGYRSKRQAKDALIALLPRAFELCDVVEIATHDRNLLERARDVLSGTGTAADRVEFQMLLGVPRSAEQNQLVSEGRTVRLYVPFAESWDEATAYLRRRLAETPSMAGLVLRNLATREA